MTAEGIQPTFTSLRPQQASVLAHHFLLCSLPRYTFYLSLAPPTSECPWDTYLHSAVSFQHSGGGGEKSHMALSTHKWFCFTIRMNVVIKIGPSLPAFHAFFLWLCDLVACLSAIPLSPSIMHRFSILYSPPPLLSTEERSRGSVRVRSL